MLKSRLAKSEYTLVNASSYSGWLDAAQVYDLATKADVWKTTDKSRRYDYVSIRNRYDMLRRLREEGNDAALLFALNEGIHGNMGGMGRNSLYQRAKFGTKQLIVDYVEEVSRSLKYLATQKSATLTLEDKVEFFQRASHCFGRSALMMSGAGSLLYFHLGVVKALWEQGVLPPILSGASGGAFVAALVGTHTHKELSKIFDPDFLELEVEKELGFFKAFSILKAGPMPVEEMKAVYERLIPDLTFQEAYELTGYQINISVAPAERHQTSRLLNAITSPNVLIREAVIASSSVPGFYPPAPLAAKNAEGEKQPYLSGRRWVDGSVSEDLPIKRLVRLYGVNHTIASQTNPMALPFIVEHKEKEEALDILKGMMLSSAKQISLASAKILKKPISRSSSLSKLVNTWVSLISQTYTGDINILPPNKLFNPVQLMQFRSKDEMLAMIRDGERATWPKIEKIRIQTQISRTLDSIIDTLEQEIYQQVDSKLVAN